MFSRVLVVDEWVREAAEEALAKAETKEVVEVESRQREVKASTKHFIPRLCNEDTSLIGGVLVAYRTNEDPR
jgi:hypothetical protein